MKNKRHFKKVMVLTEKRKTEILLDIERKMKAGPEKEYKEWLNSLSHEDWSRIVVGTLMNKPGFKSIFLSF